MTDTLRCPDCGRENPAGSEHCAHCNFPLHGPPAPAAEPERAAEPASTPEGGAPTPTEPATPSSEPPLIIRRPKVIRPPRPRADAMSLQLWLIFGTFSVGVVLWVAIQSNMQRANAPVEGANEAQQQRADALFAELAKDSTNVDIHRQLGDVLYDTANWPQAIVHYKAALRRDSSLINVMVDLGVCYYNLSLADEAEKHFRLALARDPNQNVALFNMGIVYEGRGQFEEALHYYHRALETNPPEGMRPALQQRIAALMQRLGKTAPPLPGGR